jgi:hypothetical protein
VKAWTETSPEYIQGVLSLLPLSLSCDRASWQVCQTFEPTGVFRPGRGRITSRLLVFRSLLLLPATRARFRTLLHVVITIVFMDAPEGAPEKRDSIMQDLSNQQSLSPFSKAELSPAFIASERFRRKQIVNGVLLVIVIFQLVQLPGAMLMETWMALATVLLGLALCAVAVVFNQFGKLTVVGLLLILVVDLGCGLMLLTSSMGMGMDTGMGMSKGLGVADLPVLDLLVISLLIAVSLLPPASVFVVALSNILFIIVVFAFAPRSPELTMFMASPMAYNAVTQPLILQVVVAVVAYLWVRSAQLALARADRAEEIAQLQGREAELLRHEAERSHQLEQGSEHLLQVLVRAANGEIGVRAALTQENVLWRVGNAVNLLLSRLQRVNLAESENKRLRRANVRLTQQVYEGNETPEHMPATPHPHQPPTTQRWFNRSSNPGRQYG